MPRARRDAELSRGSGIDPGLPGNTQKPLEFAPAFQELLTPRAARRSVEENLLIAFCGKEIVILVQEQTIGAIWED